MVGRTPIIQKSPGTHLLAPAKIRTPLPVVVPLPSSATSSTAVVSLAANGSRFSQIRMNAGRCGSTTNLPEMGISSVSRRVVAS